MAMLLLFAVYYVDVNFFVHTHIVNGVTIVHSHIHRNSHHASDDGGHSTWQINLVATVHNQFLFTDTTDGMNDGHSDYLVETIGYEQKCLASQVHGVHFVWRAPPMGLTFA